MRGGWVCGWAGGQGVIESTFLFWPWQARSEDLVGYRRPCECMTLLVLQVEWRVDSSKHPFVIPLYTSLLAGNCKSSYSLFARVSIRRLCRVACA